jgi:predicted metal-dependent phosphoesterase TrpH
MLTGAKVRQIKPDLELIQKKGYMILDMHVHTRFSDSFTRVNKLIKKAKKLGIGLSITDHNEIKGVLRAFEIKEDVPVMPGIEVGTAEGPHILVYFPDIEPLKEFYETHVRPEKNTNPHTNTRLSILKLIRVTRNYDCLVSVAHPYSPSYTHVPKNLKKGFVDPLFLDHVDAIEVINGAATRKMNTNAIKFAENLGKGTTGGSDSHSLFEFGTVVTCARAGNIEEFLAAVKAKRNFVAGRPVGQVSRVPSLAKSSRKHMVYFFPTFPQRYEQVIARPVRYHKPIVINKLNMVKTESINLFKDRLKPLKKGLFINKI